MKEVKKIFWQELRARAAGLWAIAALTVLGVAFETLAPWPFKLLIDNVLGSDPLDAPGFLGIVFNFFASREALGFFAVCIYTVSSIGTTVTEYFSTMVVKQVGQLMIRGFANRAFQNLEQLAVGYYRKQEIGDYIYRLSYDTSALGELVELGLLPLTTNALYLAATGVILFFINWKLALIALAMLPFLAISLAVFNRHIGKASLRSENSNSMLFSFIEEMLSQLKITQAFNQQTKNAVLFDRKETTSLVDELRVSGLGLLLNLLIGVVVAVGYGMVIIAGIRSVFLGEISTGLLIVFIFYLDNLTNPLLSFISAASSIKESYQKIARMEDFFNPTFHVADTGKRTSIGDTAITFRAVGLLGDNKTRILHNVSCTIPAGKKTVIVGVSGSGKTTLISLMLRFIERVNKGTILVGGVPIEDYSMESLREAIAYVPQEVSLFNTSIRANITFGSTGATDEQIHMAAKNALAVQFIRRLPGNYEYEVGEGGANVSGGQRQRILIARAFLRTRAKIVILDEPFSALDIKTRLALMKNIEKFAKGRTMIIISNVLELVSSADHVIVLNQGTVLHEGSSTALMQQSRLANVILNSA